MNTKRMLLLIVGMSALALTTTLARSADLQPLVVTPVTGNVHIVQDVPCGDDVDLTQPVTGGRLELTPAAGRDVPGGKVFTLTRISAAFAPFSVHRDCAGIGDTRTYTDLAVQLGKAVSFTASPSGSGFAFTIPKADFLIYQGAVVNGEPDNGYKQPSEDVTGTIDFTLGTFTMRAVIATRVHFQGGCLGDLCIINEDDDGTLTTTISGTLVLPDTDGDGIPDVLDNCPLGPNPDQKPVNTPAIVPPANLTVASCGDHNIGTALGVDVCTGNPVKVSSKAPNTFVPGKNIVTWIAQDAAGHVTTAPQVVTVVDTTPPTITGMPPNLTVNTCGPVGLGLPKATDDCGGPVTFTSNAPASYGVGTTTVTWTAHDASGNTATNTQTVTVIDTVAPAVACVPAGPPGGTFQASASDACDKPTIRLGTFVLANGEKIKISETGHAGVTLVGVAGPDHIRHFQVGKGEAIITATDGSGNVASAICR